MITFGICLIYYGVALFLYQIYGWLNAGVWTPFPVSRAWEGFFGSPGLSDPFFNSLINWFLAWPLSIALLAGGVSVLGTVFGFRRILERRQNRLRLKWLLEQCDAAGYKPWAVPKVLRELDDRLKNEKIARQEKVS